MNTKREPREKPQFDVLGRISNLRIERNWSEYELAQRTGITQSTINGWYKRKITPTLAMIEKICFAVGITLSQFFSEDHANNFIKGEQEALYGIWGKMSPDQRSAVIQLLDSFLK